MNKWNSAHLCTPQKQISYPGHLVILDSYYTSVVIVFFISFQTVYSSFLNIFYLKPAEISPFVLNVSSLYFSWLVLCHCEHRVIILLEGACLHNRIGRKWWKFSRPECVTSLETARSLVKGPSWGGGGGRGGWGRSMYSAFPGNCSVSLSLFYLWEECVGGA